MRVLVCGGRDYANDKRVFEVLTGLHTGACGPITCVIEGGAKGADGIAAWWSCKKGLTNHEQYHARWDDIEVADAVVRYRNGRPYNAAAGPQRNQRMIDEGKPTLVVAFPGGKGTADMVARARAARIPVLEVTDAHP